MKTNILIEYQLKMKNVTYIIIHHTLIKKKTPNENNRRLWTTHLLRKRELEPSL